MLRICSDTMISIFITMKSQLVKPSETDSVRMKNLVFSEIFILLGVKLNYVVSSHKSMKMKHLKMTANLLSNRCFFSLQYTEFCALTHYLSLFCQCCFSTTFQRKYWLNHQSPQINWAFFKGDISFICAKPIFLPIHQLTVYHTCS